jgi:hypothetical protein
MRPEWADDERIVYVLREGARCRLMQWSPGKSQPETLAEINMLSSPAAAYRSFAGLGRPLSGGGGRFAYYDTAADNIVLVNLRDGAARALDAGTRSGCWLDEHQFVAATDKEMLLFDQDYPPTYIIRQPSLPLGADKDGGIILCQPGKHRRSFALSRIKVTFVR